MPAGDETAATALHLLYAAAHAETELDLQDSEIVDPNKTQQSAQSLQKIGYALAQLSRLPAAPRVASQGQYNGNGIAEFDKHD